MKSPDYAELHCLSSFSFLRGASQPRELATRAVELGYAALAITDECSMAGVVRAHTALRDTPTRLIVGSELRLSEGPLLVALANDRQGYGSLCRLITRARRQAPKGEYRLSSSDLFELLEPSHVSLLWAPTWPELQSESQKESSKNFASELQQHYAARCGSPSSYCVMAPSDDICRPLPYCLRAAVCRWWQRAVFACTVASDVACTMR